MIVGAEDLELSLWVSDDAGRLFSGENTVDFAVRVNDGEDHAEYDPQSPGTYAFYQPLVPCPLFLSVS